VGETHHDPMMKGQTMYHARDGHQPPLRRRIKTALMLAMPLLASFPIGTAALAETAIETGNIAADTLIRDALIEQRIFMTCSALDATVHGYLTTTLADMVAKSAESLRRAGVANKMIAQFEAAMTPVALMPDADLSFADAVDLCNANPDWADRYARLDFILLDFRLREVFGQ
jgi:hypothetical protein